MIKIFFALGTIVSLGSPLLSQRGISRAPISSPVENLTYNVGDVWRVSFSGDSQSPIWEDIDCTLVYVEQGNPFKLIDYSFIADNYPHNVYTNYFNNAPLSSIYFFSTINVESATQHLLLLDLELSGENADYVIEVPNFNFYNIHDISFIFDIEVIGTGFNFTEDFLSLLSNDISLERIQEGGSYVAPQKSNLYRYIYDFYYSLFNEGDLSAITISGLNNMPFDSWLCHTLTIITLITGIFILFLLLRWLFKVISGFILLK